MLAIQSLGSKQIENFLSVLGKDLEQWVIPYFLI